MSTNEQSSALLGALQQLSKGHLSKETIVQGTVVQGVFCLRKTFVQEDKYLYFCPRNFCYRNEEKKLKITGNKKNSGQDILGQ